MALHIDKAGASAEMAEKLIADRPLFLDAAGNLVEAGNNAAAYQLASRKGKALSKDLAAQYRLAADKKGRVYQEPAGGAKSLEPQEDKQTKPAENKAAAKPRSAK